MDPAISPTGDERIMDLLIAGSVEELEREAAANPRFPDGVDDRLGRCWIINAIDYGSLHAIAWMIARGVDLSFVDEEGTTVLLSALDRDLPDRHEVLDLLLRCGAPTDLHGINDWTAAHMAASRDDVEALRILKRHGADLQATRNDFGITTPQEDARTLKCWNALAFLEDAAVMKAASGEAPPGR